MQIFIILVLCRNRSAYFQFSKHSDTSFLVAVSICINLLAASGCIRLTMRWTEKLSMHRFRAFVQFCTVCCALNGCIIIFIYIYIYVSHHLVDRACRLNCWVTMLRRLERWSLYTSVGLTENMCIHISYRWWSIFHCEQFVWNWKTEFLRSLSASANGEIGSFLWSKWVLQLRVGERAFWYCGTTDDFMFLMSARFYTLYLYTLMINK